MLQEEEKVVATEESEETITLTKEQVKKLKETGECTVEIEDVDVGIKEEDIDRIAKANEMKVKAAHVLNKEQQELYAKIVEEAKMPVKITDGTFQMGENELDIRYLSPRNRDQMMFRQGTLENIYLKQGLTSLIDITRLLMVLADFLGVKDIVGKTDEIIEKIEKENKIREQLKGQTVEPESTEDNKA